MEALVQNPNVVYGLAAAVVALLGGLVGALVALVKRAKMARIALEEAADANRQLEDLKETRLKLSEETESLKADSSRISRERSSFEEEASRLRERVQHLEKANADMVHKIEQLKRSTDDLSRRETDALRDKEAIESTMRKASIDAKLVAEHRAELLSRSKSMTVTMKQLLVDLHAWVRAVDEMSGMPAPFDDRTMQLRHNIQRAFDEYLDTKPSGAPRDS